MSGYPRPAVFLDRDGTINEQMGYINHLSRFRLLPGAARAIARLNRAGWPVVVASNQSGVARGYFPASLVAEVDQLMASQLEREGAHLDGIYYCFHHPRAELAAWRTDCGCRKPSPGLITRAAADLGLNLARSWVVGDRLGDIQAGAAVGARTILVLTGYGRGEAEHILPTAQTLPDHVAQDLAEAVSVIIEAEG